MLKSFLILLLCVLRLFALESEKVEVYANTMDSHGSIVEANGEVIVVYKDYFLSANRARYDRTTGELELFDNVRANNAGIYKLLGSYAKLNIAKKERTFRPFYMLDNESRVWLSGDEGCAFDKDIEIESGVMSGCDPKDPLWKMEFSSSEYNTDTKWLSLYNARIYIYDIPVLYTPYIGYSLDTTRRTGLLVPTFGISSKEGFYYEQALYIAEQNWWDLELRPQIRTNRGEGLYGDFRFVDSAVSRGFFQAGVFKEKREYLEEYIYPNLLEEAKVPNDKHYGFHFEYDNQDVLNQLFGTSLLAQSGLYIDINNMNDVDYLNLATSNALKNVTATQVLSRINLFYNTPKNYIGTYFKHYKDLTLESNENTLQKLPTLHYHHYLDTFFDDHLFYNINIQSNHIYREVNKKVIQTNINMPITIQTSAFDEYMNLSYTSENFAQHSRFSGDETRVEATYENGFYASSTNKLRVSSMLTKPYEESVHVVDFGLTYMKKGEEHRDGYYEEHQGYCENVRNKNKPECEFYSISEAKEILQLDFGQFFYDENGKQKIYHRLAQTISLEENKEKSDLENELEFQINKYLSYYNNMFYNYEMKKISKALNKVDVIFGGLNLSISHLYRDTLKLNTLNTSYLTSTLRYTYSDNYSYKASLNYDIQSKQKKSLEIGFMYKKRCWDFGLSFVENVRPLSINVDMNKGPERFLMLSIVLKPLMKSGGTSSDFALRLPENLEGN
jgi:LPS-assembly protein